jgi:hypothetical protein
VELQCTCKNTFLWKWEAFFFTTVGPRGFIYTSIHLHTWPVGREIQESHSLWSRIFGTAVITKNTAYGMDEQDYSETKQNVIFSTTSKSVRRSTHLPAEWVPDTPPLGNAATAWSWSFTTVKKTTLRMPDVLPPPPIPPKRLKVEVLRIVHKKVTEFFSVFRNISGSVTVLTSPSWWICNCV